jgi:L-fuculose-phosphate aldolase
MLLLSKQLGRVSFFTEDKERELLALKQQWGWSDPRNTEEYKNCDICANDIFRESWQNTGVERKAFPAPPPMGLAAKASSGANGSAGGMDQERLVQMITERVMAELAKR